VIAAPLFPMTMLKKLPRLFKLAFKKWSTDNAMRMAASLSYYTAFSLGPLVLAAIAVAGLIFGHEAASGQIYDQLKDTLGPSIAEAIQELVKAASKPSRGIWGTILAFVLVLFGASGVFGELKDSLNIVWKAQPKAGSGVWTWIQGRFLSIGMVLGVCFLLLVSLVINAGLGAAGSYGLSILPGVPVLMQTLTTVVSFGLIAVLFAFMFKYLPDVKVAWRDVWVGSVVTALLFTLGKTGLEIYIAKAAPGSSYGAAGALALILLWVYYSAQIFLMGAEFTSVYAAEEGSRAGQTAALHAADLVAAPPPVSTLPHPPRKPGPSSEVPAPAALAELSESLGFEKGKKVKPLSFFGRLTGAGLALMGLQWIEKKEKKLRKTESRAP
jgi:membrane protein